MICSKVRSVLLLSLSFTWAGFSHAGSAQWHWDQYGSSNYGGQIVLKDDQGGSVSYQRYADGASPSLFGATSVQSPLMVIAANKVDIDIVTSGTPVTKPTCIGTKIPAIYVSPVAACDVYRPNPANPQPTDPGLGTTIGGVQAWAELTSATVWTPRLAIYVPGSGWKVINNHACGRVQVQTMCKEP